MHLPQPPTKICFLAALLLISSLAAFTAQTTPTNTFGPRLSEAELFSALDLTRPELAAVRTALAGPDTANAPHLLAEHFRRRARPQWEIDPWAVGREPGHRDSQAEKALAHRFSSIGIEWQFGTNIDWAFNPTTQPGSKWARNHEWTWQLNRHSAWAALAEAFYATGDEKYAREFAIELRDWVRRCPVSLDRAQNVPFSRWRTIEAGIRTGSVWPRIFPRVLAAKAFDDESLLLMVRSFADHAQYLMKYPSRGNWLTMEANGLYHVGALFPEFKEAKLWRETGLGRLYQELEAQVYPDGAQIELAPGYHGVTIHNFLGPVGLVPRTGFELPGDYLAKMEKMFDYYLLSMRPDRRMLPLNDSSDGSVVEYLNEASSLFPRREDFRWVATDGRQGRAPAQLSHEFPFAGQFVFRGAWDRDALWLCMDGGPFGFGHQHEDKLSIMLNAYGQPLLVEGGTYTYDASEWRRYVLSSRAHNLVLVDGLEQNRRKAPRDSYVVREPLPHVWESRPEFDHAAARYDEGWGPDAKPIVRHTRHVFFLKPDLFVVADELQPLDGKAHTYEALFHLNAPTATVEGLRVTTGNKGPNLTILGHGVDSVRIVQGQKEPEVQGWLPDRAAGYGGIKPIPTAVYRKGAEGQVSMLYVLYPARDKAPCPKVTASLEGNRLSVKIDGGKSWSIPFQPLADRP